MAGALHKAMVYLGITEDVERYEDEYDDDVRRDEDHPRSGDGRAREARSGEVRELRGSSVVRDEHDEDDDEQPVREARRARAVEEPTPIRRGAVAASAALPDDEAPKQPRRAEVTPLPRRVPAAEVVDDVEVTGVHRITTIHPRTYNEAKKVGEAFREGIPVIMNLSDLEDNDAKRLVDFAAGLVFGLNGSIERVTNKVFLLSPSDVEVTSSDAPGRGSAR